MRIRRHDDGGWQCRSLRVSRATVEWLAVPHRSPSSVLSAARIFSASSIGSVSPLISARMVLMSCTPLVGVANQAE
jgi:hypothetical protein